jgi:hypothetical protein
MIKKLSVKKYLLTALAAMIFCAAQVSPAQSLSFRSSQPSIVAAKTIESEAFIRSELFFGRNKPDGTEVSEEEFAEFLRDAITPEFPDGLTVLDGIGQFRDASGATVREKAKVLILLYPSSAKKQSSRKIERIRRAYKTRFAQQSVLRVDDVLPVRVSF